MPRETQREPAVVAEAVEQPAARVARRRLAVLALIEKQPGLLAVPRVDLVLDRPFAHGDPIGHVAVEHVDALLEAFEQPHPRIVARQHAARARQLDEHRHELRAAADPSPATAPARPGTSS